MEQWGAWPPCPTPPVPTAPYDDNKIDNIQVVECNRLEQGVNLFGWNESIPSERFLDLMVIFRRAKDRHCPYIIQEHFLHSNTVYFSTCIIVKHLL